MAAVEPVLASTIWTETLSQDTPYAGPPPRLSTGLQALDASLSGGLDYGSMSCISAEADADTDDLLLALLVSHLLASEDAVATVIDTRLSFDLLKLHQRVVAALQERQRKSEEAMPILERLQLMKVFDFIGLTESVGEVKDEIEGRSKPDGEAKIAQTPPRGTVSDSEDEAEMLDEPTPPHKSAQATSSDHKPRSQRKRLLVIGTMSHVAQPLLKNNHAQGQALLTSFMRSLSHLSEAHNICTVLLNGTAHYSQSKEETPSIFSSCVLRPALGKTFTYLVDLHMLVHTVPRTAADAKALYGGRHDAMTPQSVNMLEVLVDRHGGRIGRWAPFAVTLDGKLVDPI